VPRPVRSKGTDKRAACVLVADQEVETRNRLDQDQSRQAEQTECPQRGQHPIGEVFRQAFDGGPDQATAPKPFGIALHESGDAPSCPGQVVQGGQDPLPVDQQVP